MYLNVRLWYEARVRMNGLCAILGDYGNPPSAVDSTN